MPVATSLLSGVPLWSLREGLAVRDAGPAAPDPAVDVPADLRVCGPWIDTAGSSAPVVVDVLVPRPSPVLREALRRMTLGPVALHNVRGLDEAYRHWQSGRGDCGPWRRVKEALDRLGGSVVPTLASAQGHGLLLSLLATARGSAFDLVPTPPGQAVTTVARAHLRPDARVPELVAPGATHRAVLHDPASLAVVETALDRGAGTVGELAAAARVPGEVARDVVGYLRAGGLVTVVNSGP
ncbi:hypothetical protein Acsp07_50160 [Actinomycetospora sp. NBRC 106378]|nr:hypothetical protein Acsp07_50160 [Actinomycetospora sp. NBRC 106378]